MYALGDGHWAVPALRPLLEDMLRQRADCTDRALALDVPGIGTRQLLLTARVVDRGQVLLLAIRDTAAQQQVEEGARAQLQIERRRLHDLFLQAPVAIAVFSGPRHVIELANPAVCAFWGRRLEDVLDRPLFEALPEAAGQGHEELLRKVLATGLAYHANEVSVTVLRDGRRETVYFSFVYQPIHELDGRISGVTVIAHEITEQVNVRVRMEELVAQVEQQAKVFDTTLGAIRDFVYMFDTAGRFTYSNRPLLELLGITLDQIVGKKFHELPYPKELATLLQQQIAHVVATGTVVTDETQYTNPAGQVGYYEYIFTPVFDDDGKVALVAGSTRDITHRKELDRQKDEFMGVVSHELRTPVTSIKAFTQVLQRRFAKAGDGNSEALLGKMDTQINKLTSLIDDLLDVTKIEAGKLQFNEEDFSFDPLVAEVIEETQRTTSRHNIEHIGLTQATVVGDSIASGRC